jgi:ABC-2 type transport system permease protein
MASFMTVFRKEIEDHFSSWRFIFSFLLVFIPSIYFAWHNAVNIRTYVTGTSYFMFLPLFTAPFSQNAVPLLPNSFLELMGVLLPIVGIALGMDAINSERSNGTLSRLISQPIYRDNIINAKFAAGAVTISILVVSLVALITGMGIRMLGVPPSAEEVWRLIFFVVIAIVYGCFWLGLAVLFSVLFKKVATSALVAIGVWLFFAIFFPLIQGLIGGNMNPTSQNEAMQSAQTLITISRLSPIQLFNEAMIMVLNPITRTTTQLLQLFAGDTAGNFLLNTPLSMAQSLLGVWPQIITTIVLTVVCFAVSYIKFMREEIRST